MMYWVIGLVTLFILIFYFYFGHSAVMLFYQCMKHDVKINYWELATMKKRGVPIDDYLRYAIRLKENGISVKIKDLELHAQSGGKIANVVDLLLKAKRNKIELTYHQAAIMDLEEVNKQKKVTTNQESSNEKKVDNQIEQTEQIDKTKEQTKQTE